MANGEQKPVRAWADGNVLRIDHEGKVYGYEAEMERDAAAIVALLEMGIARVRPAGSQ